MKDKYHKCLDLCKDLKSENQSNIRSLDNVSADKIIYEYAIKMCRSGAIDELLGSLDEV